MPILERLLSLHNYAWFQISFRKLDESILKWPNLMIEVIWIKKVFFLQRQKFLPFGMVMIQRAMAILFLQKRGKLVHFHEKRLTSVKMSKINFACFFVQYPIFERQKLRKDSNAEISFIKKLAITGKFLTLTSDGVFAQPDSIQRAFQVISRIHMMIHRTILAGCLCKSRVQYLQRHFDGSNTWIHTEKMSWAISPKM